MLERHQKKHRNIRVMGKNPKLWRRKDKNGKPYGVYYFYYYENDKRKRKSTGETVRYDAEAFLDNFIKNKDVKLNRGITTLT